MGSRRSRRVSRRNWNGLMALWGKVLLAFALGIGAAVAGTFTTFETQEAHDRDNARQERAIEELRTLIMEKDRLDYNRYLSLQERLDQILRDGFHLPPPPVSQANQN